MAAVFAIAVASSLIVASGGIAGSAFAAKKSSQNSGDGNTYTTLSDSKGGVSGPRSSAVNLPNSGTSPQDGNSNSNGISKTDLNSLSKCQSGAAADGDLTLPELKHCYTQTFNQGQDKPTDSNSAQGTDQPQNGAKQQKSTSLPEPKSTSMREGFNF